MIATKQLAFQLEYDFLIVAVGIQPRFDLVISLLKRYDCPKYDGRISSMLVSYRLKAYQKLLGHQEFVQTMILTTWKALMRQSGTTKAEMPFSHFLVALSNAQELRRK